MDRVVGEPSNLAARGQAVPEPVRGPGPYVMVVGLAVVCGQGLRTPSLRFGALTALAIAPCRLW